MSKFYF
jgi:hypothetical protein